MRRHIASIFCIAAMVASVCILTSAQEEPACAADEPARVSEAREHVREEVGKYFGLPVFLRVVKEDWAMELWVQEDGVWRILKTYDIAAMSGDIGPKTAEGDEQAPEGFYRVRPGAMNPRSSYHLSFNIGYPNKYDTSLGRTGSYIMVHGSDVSIGCFAMTDPCIEEIYTMVNEYFLAGGEEVPVQIYPFKMTPERMAAEKDSPHYGFWLHLLPGWEHTRTHSEPYADSDS